MATPLVRLAPLDLIRGFVAVGRRMSVTLAAEDLCLTQSAVSRQIHSLEDALGVSLFHRGYRSISFTPAGERLFRTADGVVRQLQDAFETITRPLERQPVTITASIGVTARWLLPRLSELQRRHPALDVRVAANDKLLDLRAEGIDLAIRYTGLKDPAPGATRLFDDTALAPDGDNSKTGGKTSGHAYWLVQADASARQDVRDVAQWIVEQAQSAAEPVPGASLAARPAPAAVGPLSHSAEPSLARDETAALSLAEAATTRERIEVS
ncbi:LysR family transcriptional regulator [Trinickia sp.]|uniref:LysR family transcriptional regulator n=1 Tax=Trinickia sp. TaxID=2571163 RepID=UPI003F816D5F